jgi:hypothetical protein
MSGSDGEFDDFLARRKPLFQRPPDDVLEPPPELDRIVLRQARDAIRRDNSEPAYHGTRWGMPIALAATVLVAATIVLSIGMPENQPTAEVTVQNVGRQTDSLPQAEAAPPAAPPPKTATRAAEPPSANMAMQDSSAAPAVATGTAPVPGWRRDQRSWLAEIERLRSAGKTAQADAEMAEFRRQNRAYAVSPDR